MKTLKFKPHLVVDIKEGRKTSTWRLFDDKGLSLGDKLELIDSESGENFAEAEIISMREKKLREVAEADFGGHERYSSSEDMLGHYKEYYGDKVSFDTVVKIIDFKILRFK